MVEQEDGPDLAAELRALRAELEKERSERKADSEKALRDMMAFASMRQAPAPQAQAGPKPPRDIDWDALPDPDLDRKKYDRALEAERRRVAQEQAAYDRAQAEAQQPKMDHGKRIYDMVRKQLPDADEEDLNYIAGKVAKTVPGDISTYAAHFGEKMAGDIVSAYQSKFGRAGQEKPAPQAEDNSRSESIFGGVMDGPSAPEVGGEKLGSLTDDLATMQRKSGWSWG